MINKKTIRRIRNQKSEKNKKKEIEKLKELGQTELAEALDDSEQQSEDNIFDQLIQNLPFDNDKPYIEHVKRTNTFSLKQDPDQTKKSEIWIPAADGKIKR